MDLNKEVKNDLQKWLAELNANVHEYEAKVDQLETEIELLKVRDRLITRTVRRIGASDTGYIFDMEKRSSQEISEKKRQLSLLLTHEKDNKEQVKKLIDEIEKEINKFKASE